MVWSFNSKCVGVTFNGRQENIPKVHPGFKLFWEHEPHNPYDENAIKLFADPAKQVELGHLSAEVAKKFVGRMKKGVKQEIIAEQVTGGEDKKSYGLNMKIVVHEDNEKEDSSE